MSDSALKDLNLAQCWDFTCNFEIDYGSEEHP
ncbi:hypothetical protein EE612_010686 [Oryza sativa]|nr:hypothetical protein EE612_010686 [Oryza sativa]